MLAIHVQVKKNSLPYSWNQIYHLTFWGPRSSGCGTWRASAAWPPKGLLFVSTFQEHPVHFIGLFLPRGHCDGSSLFVVAVAAAPESRNTNERGEAKPESFLSLFCLLTFRWCFLGSFLSPSVLLLRRAHCFNGMPTMCTGKNQKGADEQMRSFNRCCPTSLLTITFVRLCSPAYLFWECSYSGKQFWHRGCLGWAVVHLPVKLLEELLLSSSWRSWELFFEIGSLSLPFPCFGF
jgi:hypothetical protein